MIKENAYAKINLALEVMDVEDGYHKVNNLMIPIELHDELTFTKNDEIVILDDPFPGENIIEKAARLFFQKTNISGGVLITVKKNIPHAAGLAGGSTDAAATLKGLNKLYDAGLTRDELIEMSAALGSDVGFFVDTKIALCTGRGEIIVPLDVTPPKLNVLLIKQRIGLSTAMIYKNYTYDGTSKKDKIDNIIEALRAKKIEEVKKNIFNDLENVALKVSETLKKSFDRIKDAGIDVHISGSGPTMYVLDPTMEEILKIKSVAKADTFILLTNTF